MKKFILSAVMFAMFVATYAQYTRRIIPVRDNRIEFGVFNRTDIFSFPSTPTEYDYQEIDYSMIKSAEGNLFNPGIYLGYGFTEELFNEYISFENMAKIIGLKRECTLYGEKWTSSNINDIESFSVVNDDICIGLFDDIMLKLHLLDDQLETSIGISLGAAINVKDIFAWELGAWPQLKLAYKIDKFYFCGTLGFDALNALGLDFNIFQYTNDDIKYNSMIFTIGFGYIME